MPASPMDMAIATMLNKDLKNCVTMCAKSACETTSSQLREVMMEIAVDGVRRQEMLSKMMIQKGMYVAPPIDQQTMSQIMPQLQAIEQSLNNPAAMNNMMGGGVGTTPNM